MLFKHIGKFFKRVVRRIVKPAMIIIFARTIELLLLIPILCICAISRFSNRDIDVGLGPFSMINNVYFKAALIQAGYSAETFVYGTSFITDEFDCDLTQWQTSAILKRCTPFYLFIRNIFRYRVLFIYFNGCAFLTAEHPFNSGLLHALEPLFYKLANVKTVVMPYGGDVLVLERCRSLYYRHSVIRDYPKFWQYHELNRRNIDRWTRHANWIMAGGDSVEYLYYWNSLAFNFLPIDTRRWEPIKRKRHHDSIKLRILHAPNHPKMKGTDALIAAIELLKSEGLELELILLQEVPNDEIRRAMADVDLVADQFVIGCYGLFAIEAMAMGKPVLCYLREDLVELYIKAGEVTKGGIPLINTDLRGIATKIRWAYHNREELRAIGKKGRDYVQNHHSIEHMGNFFAGVLNELGIRNGSKAS